MILKEMVYPYDGRKQEEKYPSSHIFSKLMKYREEADYNPSYIFIKEDFVEFKKEAEGLANKINGYLEEKDYL